MNRILEFWNKLPAIIRALIAFVFVAYLGLIGTNVLFDLNDSILPDFPWSAFAVILFLVIYVAYLKGWGWPGITSEYRKDAISWNKLNKEQWKWGALCVLIAFIFVPASIAVSFRFVEISPDIIDRSAEIAGMPLWVALAYIIALSASAGVWEEVAFRGYLQKIIQNQHGIYWAIGISALLFWLAHFNSASGPLRVVTLLLGAVMLSTLAYSARSIIPGVVDHISSDIYTGLHTRNIINPDYLVKFESIWKTGLDAHFVIWSVVLVASIVTFIPTVKRLYSVTRQDD